MCTNQNRQTGFTLIELLVAMTILAITATLAAGIYDGYVRSSKRTDAQLGMLQISNQLMKYRSNTGSYTDQLSALGYTSISPQGFYVMSISLSATGFTVSARPNPGTSQVKDYDCQYMAITHNQVESSTDSHGNDSTTECWPTTDIN